MKRFQIVILTIMLASLSACATNSLPSSSTESSVSISVSNPQDFLSELEDMETSQILEELKISDGGYTEDCFSVLSKRLVEFPEDTLCILNHNKLMADTDFEALVITGIGAELPYIGAAEEKDTLATVYKGNIIKNLIMDCQSYTKYRPNETTGGIFVSWRRKEELPTGA